MDVLREREVKDSLERQLGDEQKLRALVQKRLRRERRDRRQIQEQLETEVKRRMQLEEALRAAGAGDQIRIINEKCTIETEQKMSNQKNNNNSMASQSVHSDRDRVERPERQERECMDDNSPTNFSTQAVREQPTPESKPWGYSGIDLINSGAAFWQNYSGKSIHATTQESLAQELELERKSRQQQVERDVKSPLQDRSGYYKNSVLFTSSAT